MLFSDRLIDSNTVEVYVAVAGRPRAGGRGGPRARHPYTRTKSGIRSVRSMVRPFQVNVARTSAISQ